MADHMRKELALDALGMAVAIRQPGPGLIHHSDRGSQYASEAYRSALDAHGIKCSMSGVGNCYDNAMQESFFHTLKVEYVNDANFQTREEAKSGIFEYIEGFYNIKRLHSGLDYKTPQQKDQEAA
jgi:transposase InsO family protein